MASDYVDVVGALEGLQGGQVNATFSGRPIFGTQSVARTPEVQRIASLPRRIWTPEAGEQLAADMTRELKTPKGTMRLRALQAIALYEAMVAGGLFAPIFVGGGKTLISLALPLALEAKRPMLLLPASLIEKTTHDRNELAKHFRLPTNIQLLSYEMLGLVQSADKLEYACPDLLILDEAHYCKNKKAGRVRRLSRYMHDHPSTKLCAMSGTIMKSSILDFAPILRWALKQNAPIPSTVEETIAWAEALDEKINPLARRNPGAIFDLGKAPTGVDSLTAARRVFQSRLLGTEGVVASTETDGVGCSLTIRPFFYELSEVTAKHFNVLRSKWETPCGNPFAEALEFRRHARELALGFHYTWIAREKIDEWENLALQSRKRVELSGRKTIDSNTLSEKWKLKDASEKNTPSRPESREKRGSALGSILLKSVQLVPQSTKNGESPTEKSLPLLKPPAQRTQNGEQRSRTTSERQDTEFLRNNTQPFLLDAEIVAKYVEIRCETGEAVDVSTTITQPEKYADCCASDATEPWGFSEIALGLSEPMRIFLEQNRAPCDWLNARRTWSIFVRETLSSSQKYDTMLQVARACDAGLLDATALTAWREVEDSYKPLTRAVFHDTGALEACLKWMEKERGIVWVEHRAFGETLARLAKTSYYEAGGLDAEGNSIKDAKPGKAIVASIAACGQGFNLQMFSANLLTSCPSGPSTVEQLLGRTHRPGQEADEVTVDIMFGCVEHHEAYFRAIDGARAAADTLGHDQKILLATSTVPMTLHGKRGPMWGETT